MTFVVITPFFIYFCGYCEENRGANFDGHLKTGSYCLLHCNPILERIFIYLVKESQPPCEYFSFIKNYKPKFLLCCSILLFFLCVKFMCFLSSCLVAICWLQF